MIESHRRKLGSHHIDVLFKKAITLGDSESSLSSKFDNDLTKLFDVLARAACHKYNIDNVGEF